MLIKAIHSSELEVGRNIKRYIVYIEILVQRRNSHGSFKLKILIKRLLYLYHRCQEKKL